MADLEQRVATLERDMSVVKARVSAMDEDLQAIPDLIKLEHRQTRSQIARVSQDVAELQRSVVGLQGEMVSLRNLPAKVGAMPRVIAELVAGLLAERDRKR